MYEHLFSPIQFGGLELRNRIAMAPMGVELGDENGAVTDGVIGYYEERARGGAGLLITENVSAGYPWGANSAHELAFSEDRYIPGLQRLTQAVHAHGAKIAAQLSHHGKVARLDMWQGRELIMPSLHAPQGENSMGRDLTAEEIEIMAHAMSHLGKPKVRAATPEDIEALIEAFASAARRAREAGFDAVEIHAAHGYIFSEFLSPAYNHREDAYGGSRENRARLLCEVIERAHEEAGADFPVWCRIDAEEFRTQGGTTLEDAMRTAELAEAAGAAAIHVSAYSDGSSAPGFLEAPLVHREGGFVDFAASIKARVTVPVIAVGRIEPEQGDALIRDGKADMISMARKLLADPALPNKLAEGRPEDVRPCVYCYTCVAQAFFDRPVKCAVNPVTAREAEWAELERTPAPASRHVLVIGGGPSGMEAARVAAARGHRVTLWEKAEQLGGTLRFAALPYPPNERLLRWLETQVRKADIEVHTGVEATPVAVRALGADAVLVAVGPRRENPVIPGIDLPHVFDGDSLRDILAGQGGSEKLSLAGRMAVKAGRAFGMLDDPGRLRELSRRYLPLPQRVTILGGGLVGVELAEFLHERGREVVVLEEGPVLGHGFAHPRRWRILHELREAKVRMETGARVLEILAGRVRVEITAGDGAVREDSVAADGVIVATGLVANPGLGESLRAAGLEVTEIGDCTGVRYIEGAMHSGFEAALAL